MVLWLHQIVDTLRLYLSKVILLNVWWMDMIVWNFPPKAESVNSVPDREPKIP